MSRRPQPTVGEVAHVARVSHVSHAENVESVEGKGFHRSLASKGIIDRLSNPTMKLHISAVPFEAGKEFKALAKSKFKDDYGLALAFLLSSFKDKSIVVECMKMTMNNQSQLNDIQQKLLFLSEEEEKSRTTPGGEKRIVPRSGG